MIKKKYTSKVYNLMVIGTVAGGSLSASEKFDFTITDNCATIDSNVFKAA